MRINKHVLSLLIGISLGTGPALAQQWCTPGAMWSHTYFADGPEGIEDGVIVSKYLGDTLIGLQSMQLIERELRYRLNGGDVQFYPWPSFYTFISNGVVFSWDSAAQQADTLLWYSAVPGQHWFAYDLENVHLRFEVIDTSTVFIEGLALRQLIVNYLSSSDVPPTILRHDTLIERIGLIVDDFFDPEIPWADGALMSFQCYSDEILDYRRSGPTICDFTLTVNPIEPLLPPVAPSPLFIYPNPAKSYVTLAYVLEDVENDAVLVLRGVDGRELKRMPLSTQQGQQLLDTRSYTPGTYSVELLNNGERIATEHLILKP